jgi:hypothetical protein
MPFTEWPGMSYKLPNREYWRGFVEKTLERSSGISRKEMLETYHQWIFGILADDGLIEEPDYEHIDFIKFDLRLPLEPQLRLAKKQLKRDQGDLNPFALTSTFRPS